MSNNENLSSKSLVEAAEKFSKTATSIAIILLVMSIFYDYNFFIALGLSFNEIPSSTTEHVRSALLWIPYGILLLIVMAFEEARTRIKGENNEPIPKQNSDASIFQILFFERRDKVVGAAIIITIFFLFFCWN